VKSLIFSRELGWSLQVTYTTVCVLLCVIYLYVVQFALFGLFVATADTVCVLVSFMCQFVARC